MRYTTDGVTSFLLMVQRAGRVGLRADRVGLRAGRVGCVNRVDMVRVCVDRQGQEESRPQSWSVLDRQVWKP